MIALAALLPLLAADLYPVTGTVTNGLTKSPVPHAQVYIYRSGGQRPGTPYITGTDGRFSFNLPAGSYALHAGIRGDTQTYGSHNESPGSAVIVGPGKDTTNLIFRFYPMASISGKVLDDAGDPVENATVQLIRTSVVSGLRMTRDFRSVSTDDRGDYRLGWIPAADRYYITVTGQPWYSKRTSIAPITENIQAYAATYYPNTSDAAHAEPIKVAPGEEMHADFTLRAVVGAKILVKHDAPRFSTGQVSLTYPGVAGIEAVQHQEGLLSMPPGFERPQPLLGVPPGNYLLRVTALSGTTDLIGMRRIAVNGTDVTVDIPLHPAATVTGTLKFQNAETRPNGALVVLLTRSDGAATYAGPVKPDGSFLLGKFLPAKYRATIGSADGYFPAKVEVSGAAWRDGLIEIGDGDSISMAITASDETGSVSGYVKAGEKAIGGVLAVLAAVPPVPMGYRGFQTESDGSFDMRNVPAGDYLLFAIDNASFEYNNPEVVRPYLAAATPVRIDAHRSSTLSIPLTETKP